MNHRHAFVYHDATVRLLGKTSSSDLNGSENFGHCYDRNDSCNNRDCFKINQSVIDFIVTYMYTSYFIRSRQNYFRRMVVP